MKSVKCTIIACIVMMSFVLSLSLAYAAERLRTITPQQTVVPSKQPPPKEFKQLWKLNPMFKITSPKTTDVLYFDKTYPITWDRLGGSAQSVSFRVMMASDPSKGYSTYPVPNTSSYMLKLNKIGSMWRFDQKTLTKKPCFFGDTPCFFEQEEDPNKEYIIQISTVPCGEGWICEDKVKVKIMNQ